MLTTVKNWLAASQPAGRPRRAMLAVERLSDRALPSASLAGGTLTITGTGDHDTVLVTRQYFEGTGWVRVNEQRRDSFFTYPARNSWFRQSDVSRIVFNGQAGNDTFANGLSIRSSANGGDGDDELTGGTGIDTLHGDAGHDRLFGWAGNDHLYGDFGNDVIQGGAGIDHVYGGADNDKLFGGSSYDYVYGEDGDDFLDDGGRSNFLDGGPGLDFNARVLALSGATEEDVNQAQSPTCGCLAAIQSVANTGRDLRTLITYPGVGDWSTNPVYGVRLFRDGAWRNFNVEFNGDLVTHTTPDGSFNVYDAVPESDSSPTNRGCEQQSWVTILQRAYLDSKGVNWRNWHDVKENGTCDPGRVMKALTGRDSSHHDSGSVVDRTLDAAARVRIMDALAANKPVTAATYDHDRYLATERLVKWHVYSVINCYTRWDGMTMFVLRNPWGYDGGTDRDDDGMIDGADSAPNDAIIHVSWESFRRSIQDYWIGG